MAKKMAKNPSSQVLQIEFVKDCLRNGKKRGEILSLFGKKWQNVSSRTFDRRLKVAESSMQSELRTIEVKTGESISKEVQARKTKILTAIERQEILTQIAKGEIKLMKYIVCDGVIEEKEVVPDYADRKAAIAELNKMDGSYAPQKQDINITEAPSVIRPGKKKVD